mgnify:CR=1 FL=1
MKMPDTILIAVIIGVTNVIPFFGPFIGAIPTGLMVLALDPGKTIWFVIFIIALQQLDGNVIGPKIVGNALGIGSFWVLVSVLIGGGLFGFPGMALGVPVFAVFYRYADKLMTNSLKRREKNTHTSYYYSLEPYGLEDDEVELEPDRKQQQSWFSRFRKEKKDFSQNKFAFDHNDGDQNRIGEVKDKNKDLLE